MNCPPPPAHISTNWGRTKSGAKKMTLILQNRSQRTLHSSRPSLSLRFPSLLPPQRQLLPPPWSIHSAPNLRVTARLPAQTRNLSSLNQPNRVMYAADPASFSVLHPDRRSAGRGHPWLILFMQTLWPCLTPGTVLGAAIKQQQREQGGHARRSLIRGRDHRSSASQKEKGRHDFTWWGVAGAGLA